MLNTRCIYVSMADVILCDYGELPRKTFIDALSKVGIGLGSTAGFPEKVQISMLNNFWRGTLNGIPGTTEIKAWLTDGDNSVSYMNDFRNYWSKLIIGTGVI